MNNSNELNSIINGAEKQRYMPNGYMVNKEKNTLYKIYKDKKIAICNPLYVEALARNPNGENWGRLLQWQDQDGKQHEWAMPSEMLAGDGAEYRRILLDRGLSIRAGKTAQNALHDYILCASPPDRASSVSMTGWHGKQYMAVDNKVYGLGKQRILLQMLGAPPKLNKSGSLESWQENVAKYAVGNSRLVFAISAAFAGILLYPVNEGSGGLHFLGGSSIGKTTILRASTSVWGLPMRSWRTTDNAAESWAKFANDGFLVIDELGQADAYSVSKMAYMLGNGQTKGRSDRNGIARETSDFRLIFLSTGELSLADKVAETGRSAKAGQMVRMLDIPADAGADLGIFENLHGFNGGAEFSRHLEHMTEQHKGYAITAFLEQITALDFTELQTTIKELVRHWVSEHVPANANGQVLRAANKFALIAVAGEMARGFGILPWKDQEANNAAFICYNAWLSERGGIGSHEVREGIRAIRSFIESNGASRFNDIDNSGEKVINRAGFKRSVNGGDETEFLIFPRVFKGEVLSGSKNDKAIIRQAIDLGLIKPDGQGKNSVSVRINGLGQQRFYCITLSKYKSEERI